MIKLIGIPFDKNSSFLRGASLAPPLVRLMDKNGSANGFAENGIEIIEGENYKDEGDINFDIADAAIAFNVIKSTIAKELEHNNKCCCIGGDHSISYPVIDAYTDVYSNLHVLHFDAHADLYKNFENNPFSHASPFARLLEKGKIKSLTQVGIRTLNTHQRQQAATYNVKLVEMKDFNDGFIADLDSPLYLSIDLDVLDPAFAPGVSHHEPGGLSTRELINILQRINAQIVGADIVEYNPIRDINNMTAMVAYKILKELIAKMLL